MRVLSYLLASIAAISSVQAISEPPTKLQIGIKYKVPEELCTRRSHDGDKLSMHYTGTLFDTGAKFDSSLDRNQPLEFTLGVGQVIRGWDDGLKNMCIGEKRKLVIPPHLAYGDRDIGSIPPGSTLVFEVELMDINPGKHTFDHTGHTTDKSAEVDRFAQFQSPAFLLSTGIMLTLFVVVFLYSKKNEAAKESEVPAKKAPSPSNKKTTKSNKI